jgi:hypothetical protein
VLFSRPRNGPVAEWLGRALQKLPQRFESARDLDTKPPPMNRRRLFSCNTTTKARFRKLGDFVLPICPFKAFIYFYIMKHSQTIGILLCLALIYTTTQPFVIIESRHWVITGWNPAGSSFGQSGKFLSFFSVLSAIFFALPFIWAKRFNMVFGALMLSWSFRNYLILSTCQMGECPLKQWALYGCIILSGLILLMTFLPKIKVS